MEMDKVAGGQRLPKIATKINPKKDVSKVIYTIY